MSNDAKAEKRFSGGKIALIVAAVVVLLLGLVYFYISSRAFVQSVVLPRVSEEVGAEVTAEVVKFRPFSELHLRQIRAQTPGYEPLLQADELLVRYHLWSILRGVTRVGEFTLVAPVLHIVEGQNGSSNLDPIAFLHEPPSKEPARVDIRNLSITNAVVRFVQRPERDVERITELANLSLQIGHLQNSAPGNLRLETGVRFDAGARPEFLQNRLSGTLNAQFDFMMDAELAPTALEGAAHLHVAEAEGLLSDLAQMRGVFEADFTAEEVRTVAMRFERDGAALGQVRAHGSFSVAQMEGRLNIEIVSIDRQALNLAGAPFGIDFGPTTINATNVLEMARGGAQVTMNGRFIGSSIQLAQEGRTTPRLDLEGAYDLRIDQDQQIATVETFTLAGAQEGQPFLRGGLTRPMRLDWSAAEAAVDESAFALEVTDLDLEQWADFLGLAGGRVRGTLTVLSRESGRDLSIELDSRISHLTAHFAEQVIEGQATIAGRAQVAEFDRVRVPELRAEVLERDESIAVASLTGEYHHERQFGEFRVTLSAHLQPLFEILPPPDFGRPSGTLNLDAVITQQPGAAEELVISLTGDLSGSAIGVARAHAATPPIDLQSRFDLVVNQAQQTARIRSLDARVIQRERTILKAALAEPMPVSWGEEPAAGNGRVEVTFSDLELADWRALFEDQTPSGRMNATLTVASQRGGQTLHLDLTSQIAELSADIGEERFAADAVLNLRAQAHELKRIHIEELRAELSEQQRPFALLTLSGPYNLETEEGELQLDLQAELPAVTALLADPEVTARAGLVRFTGRLLQEAGLQDVSGQLALSDFTGRFGDYEFDRYTTTVETRVERREHLFQIHRAAGEFQREGAPAGRFDVTGQFDSERETGQFQIALEELSEHALGPLLQPMLGERRLVSVSLNGQAEALYDGERDSFLKGRFDLADLVVTDPDRGEPAQPLSATLGLDAVIQEQKVDLREVQLALSPTARGQNRIQLQGHLDISDREAIVGQLALISKSLDVTPFYDLYSPAEPAAAPDPAPPATEPDPVDLPVRRLVLDFNIGEFFLREIAMTNLEGALQIEENRVVMEPIESTLNDAPITLGLDIDLGVPGYAYDVRFNADRVPLDPLVNSFMPEQRGQYQGLLVADTHLRGAGVTGASMRRALTGHFDLSITNANIQLVSPRVQQILVPIAAILRAEEITRTPLNLVDVRTEFGGGNIQVRELTAMSGAFMGRTKGAIPIADEMLQSPLRMPLEFHLRRSLAQRIRAVPADTPPEVEYIRLPNFAGIVGTLDDPSPEIDRRALAGSILEHLIPAIPGLDPEVGEIFRGFGEILRGLPGQPRQPQPQAPPEQPQEPQKQQPPEPPRK